MRLRAAPLRDAFRRLRRLGAEADLVVDLRRRLLLLRRFLVGELARLRRRAMDLLPAFFRWLAMYTPVRDFGLRPYEALPTLMRCARGTLRMMRLDVALCEEGIERLGEWARPLAIRALKARFSASVSFRRARPERAFWFRPFISERALRPRYEPRPLMAAIVVTPGLAFMLRAFA